MEIEEGPRIYFGELHLGVLIEGRNIQAKHCLFPARSNCFRHQHLRVTAAASSNDSKSSRRIGKHLLSTRVLPRFISLIRR